MSLLAWLTLFMFIYSGSISFNIKRWLFVISITIFSLSIKNFIKTPYILEGSNVFIGGDFENSIFKEKIPPIIFNHLNEDFKKNFLIIFLLLLLIYLIKEFHKLLIKTTKVGM